MEHRSFLISSLAVLGFAGWGQVLGVACSMVVVEKGVRVAREVASSRGANKLSW